MASETNSSQPSKITVSRVISGISLLLATTALLLALRKPQPVAVPQTRTAIQANAQSFQDKVDQLAQPSDSTQGSAEVHLTPDEVNAAIAQASGAVPATSASTNAPDVNAAIGDGSIDLANMPEPVVSFDGDQIKGQFVSELHGKKVYVTVAGHLGSKDGYASFEPTEFKVGDLNVPVSLVNDALQKKLLEQRDRLKLPDYVSNISVQNGELVVTKK